MTELVRRRNPPWSYNELVLAMDLYVRRGTPSATDPEVVELSEFLNRLQAGHGHDVRTTFRNPNGVYLKLCNFRAKERPGHGMAHGNHLEHDVWDRFANNRPELYREVAAIRRRPQPPARVDPDPQEPTADNRRNALIRLIKSSPVPMSKSPKGATRLLMALIREAVELQTVLTDHDLRASEPEDSASIRIGTMIGLLADVADAIQMNDPIVQHRARKLAIFPCGDRGSIKHFNRTMRRPVDLTAIGLNLDLLSESLPSNYPISRARVWGVMPRRNGLNETRFQRCSAGDVALFTGNRLAFSAATIQGTLRSAELARALWHTDVSGGTWALILLLSEPIDLQIPYEELNKALGYNSKFAFQAFSVLSESASRRAIQALNAEIGHLWAS